MNSKPKPSKREKRVCSLCGKAITGVSYTEWWTGGVRRMAHADCFCAEDGGEPVTVRLAFCRA